MKQIKLQVIKYQNPHALYFSKKKNQNQEHKKATRYTPEVTNYKTGVNDVINNSKKYKQLESKSMPLYCISGILNKE